MEVDAAYHGCLPSCELHSTSLAVGRTVACGSWDCAHVLRNPEIACSVSGFQECATQSRDCTNSQIARNIYTCAQCYTYCSICSPYYEFGACFPPWTACCSVTSFKAALPDPIVSKSLYSVNHPRSQRCRRMAHPPLRWIYLPFCVGALQRKASASVMASTALAVLVFERKNDVSWCLTYACAYVVASTDVCCSSGILKYMRTCIAFLRRRAFKVTMTGLPIFHTTFQRESSVINGGGANMCEMMHSKKIRSSLLAIVQHSAQCIPSWLHPSPPKFVHALSCITMQV